MSGYIDQLKIHLQKKRSRLEDMEKIFHIQDQRLDENDHVVFGRLCDRVDGIILELKNIDYEIARLESSSEVESVIYDSLHDNELACLFAEIGEKARRNDDLLRRLADKLIISKGEIKKELDNTVAGRQLKGYRPFERENPIYYDKRN